MAHDDRDHDEELERVSRAVGRAAVQELGQDIDALTERVNDHAEQLVHLRERTARHDGMILHLHGAYDRAAATAAEHARAELEIRHADAMAKIREREASAGVKRDLLYKAMAFIAGLGPIVYAVLQARC